MGKKWQVFFLTHPELLNCNMCFSFRHGLSYLGIKGPSLSILRMGCNLGSVFYHPSLPCPSHVQELGMQRQRFSDKRTCSNLLVVPILGVFTASTAVLPAMTKWGYNPSVGLLWLLQKVYFKKKKKKKVYLKSPEAQPQPDQRTETTIRYFYIVKWQIHHLCSAIPQYLMNLLASTTKSWTCILFAVFPLVLLILKGVKWLIFLDFQSFLAEKIGNERITFCPSKFSLTSAYKLNLSSKKYPNSSLAARRSNFNWGQKNPPNWALYKGTSYINGCCF